MDGIDHTEGHLPLADPLLEELHRQRAEYAAQFDYNLEAMLKDLQAKEAFNPAPRACLQPLEPKRRNRP